MTSCAKRILLPLAAAFLLLSAGGKLASAQSVCDTSSSAAPVRSEGTVEILGAVALRCTGVAAVPATITITVGAPLAAVSDTPNNRTTFPLPVLTSSAGFVIAPQVTARDDSVTFAFTPSAGAQDFAISGIRANIAVSGLPVGAHLEASLSTSSLSLTNHAPTIGIVTGGLGQGSGFPNNPLNLVACSTAIPAPSRRPASVNGNPDPSATAANSLRLVLVEGFPGAFLAAPREDGSFGLQGTRFRVQLRGIPGAIIPYAPRAVRVTSDSTTGRILPAGSSLVIQRVDDADEDGSGGVVLPEVPDQFDKIEVTGDTATLIYEVTADSIGTSDTITLFIALSAASNPGSATVRASFSLAPLGPPTDAPSRPQFTFSTAISLSTRRLEFVQFIGSDSPARRVLIANPGAGVLEWSANARTRSGGDWLAVTPDSGTDNGTLFVSIPDASLPEGTYRGEITISAPDAVNSPQTVSVSLIVTPRPVLTVRPSELNFRSVQAGTIPPAQQLSIQNLGVSIAWRATAQTSSGGNWLTVSPTSGATGYVARVSVNPAGLAPGVYQGSITVSAPDSANASETILVSLLVGPPNTVVNGASFLADAGVSPGMVAVLFGSELAETAASAPPGTLPTLLRNTQVLVNGVAAPLLYVSPTQINFQVPLEISGSTAQMVVVSNGVQGPTTVVGLTRETPGIFTIPETGTGAVLNEDSTLNSAGNPARAGSVVQIFATGLGAVSPLVPAGQPAAISPLSETVTTPVVLIGGIPAEVSYSGLAPGTVGVYQINARIPASVPASAAVPVQIQMGAAASNAVTIAVE